MITAKEAKDEADRAIPRYIHYLITDAVDRGNHGIEIVFRQNQKMISDKAIDAIKALGYTLSWVENVLTIDWNNPT